MPQYDKEVIFISSLSIDPTGVFTTPSYIKIKYLNIIDKIER